MTEYTLHYQRFPKVLARIIPDEIYPSMYRIHWPNGDISDMVNLTRAKDAAVLIARRRYPEHNQSVGWIWRYTQRRHGRSPVRFEEVAATGHRATPKNASRVGAVSR